MEKISEISIFAIHKIHREDHTKGHPKKNKNFTQPCVMRKKHVTNKSSMLTCTLWSVVTVAHLLCCQQKYLLYREVIAVHANFGTHHKKTHMYL